MFSRGYVWVRYALRPVVSQPPACQPAACWSRFCWTPHDVTQGTALPYRSAIHRGGLLSSHKERAALHGAHKVVLTVRVRTYLLLTRPCGACTGCITRSSATSLPPTPELCSAPPATRRTNSSSPKRTRA